MKSMTKSKLSKEQIAALVRAAFGESAKLRSVREEGGGMFNAAYVLSLGNVPDGAPETLVLKASVSPGDTLLTYEAGAVRTEAEINGRLRAAGVPVPEIVRADFSRTRIDRDYIFMTKLPGVTWFQVNTALSFDNKNRLKEQLGEYAALIHSVRHDRFGYPSSGRMYAGWREAFMSMLEDVISDAQRRRLRLPYKEIMAAAGSRKALLDEIKEPRLVHFDLWAGNILLTERDGVYDIGGIIDFERAFYGDPCADFISAMMIYDDVALEPAFLAGYGRKRGGTLVLGESDRTRMLLYRLYLTIITAVEARRYPRGFSQYVRAACRKQLRYDLDTLKLSRK